MVYVNLNDFNETVEFLTEIDHLNDYSDFISSMNVDKNIFINGDYVIPFNKCEINETCYLVYHGDNQETIDLLQKWLIKHNYDLGKLKPVPFQKIIDNIDFYKDPYFLINGNIMK